MEQQPFFLALDCGEISTHEATRYQHAPAYRRARASIAATPETS